MVFFRNDLNLLIVICLVFFFFLLRIIECNKVRPNILRVSILDRTPHSLRQVPPLRAIRVLADVEPTGVLDRGAGRSCRQRAEGEAAPPVPDSRAWILCFIRVITNLSTRSNQAFARDVAC